MHGNGLFITHYGDRYQGRFHNDRFLNQSGQWVVPQVIPPDEVAAAFKMIASLEPRPIPTMAPVLPEGMMKRKDEEAADAAQLAGSEVQAAST